jgi:hypothetical protein
MIVELGILHFHLEHKNGGRIELPEKGFHREF